MKITMYELLGMIKNGKASDIMTNFIFDREKYNLLGFLQEYTLDKNSLNWEIKIIEEEKKIPEKLTPFEAPFLKNDEPDIRFRLIIDRINEICDYLNSKGE